MINLEYSFCSESNYFLLLILEEKWVFCQRLKWLSYKLNLYSIMLVFIFIAKKM